MKLRKVWGRLLVITTAAATFAGACSAVNPGHAATGSGGGTGGVAQGPGSGGTEDDGGLFSTSSGGGDASTDQGGQPTSCDPSCQIAGGQCVNFTCTIVENPGNVDPGTIPALEGGGAADPSFKLLYPYDQTVFPRGLLPPTMQFAGGAPEFMYLHVSFPGLDYKGFYGASSPGSVVLSTPVWKAITLASTGKPDVKVEVTKMSGGQVAGPISETWTIAKGSLRGTIYYETYGSQILGGAASVGIMKIQPGASTPTVIKSGCGNVCHTASADGSTLVAATGLGSSASYDLKNNAATIHAEPSDKFTYGALTPDGSLAISATNYRTWFGSPSSLYDIKTGAKVAAPGWDGVITNAGTPAFAPDGTMIAFNREDIGGGHRLDTMKFNQATRTFSALTPAATDPSRYLGWPAFTPDTKGIVYHAGSQAEFETDSGATADLFWLDLATHQTARLDALDGYKNGQSYLPDNDPNLSFAPTVLPEAVGGYFWIVFTSHRGYGNTLASHDDNGKLWVAALDINGAPSTDPSHPAFFLDGQETMADNLRGFWVLDPCKANGTDCTSGDECCDGFCRMNDGGAPTCSPMSGGCSHEFEKCTTAADCCDSGYDCVNGKCAQPPPPK
jgi:hypothetical protein